MSEVKLILGDCLEIIRDLEPESVDIVLTSPPYNVGLNYQLYEDNLSADDYEKFTWSWIAGVYRLMAENSRAYFVLGDKLIYSVKPVAESIGLTYVQKLTWCKPNMTGTRITEDWNHLTEDILLFRKGKRTPMLNGEGNTHNFFVIAHPQTNFVVEKKEHPAQFPVKLTDQIISRTPGKKVLDPFAGSGTVALSCLKFDRDFIGIENDPAYYSVAERRIRDAQSQPSLFSTPERQLKIEET